MLYQPSFETCPLPLSHFLLVKNQSSKDIAGSDITIGKFFDGYKHP